MNELAILAIACAVAGAAGFFAGMEREADRHAAIELHITQQAAERERELRRGFDATNERIAALRADADARADALAGELRNRPARAVPGAARAACDRSGADGRDLSRPDAEFLVGEAARAVAAAIELGRCREAYEAARVAAGVSHER